MRFVRSMQKLGMVLGVGFFLCFFLALASMGFLPSTLVEIGEQPMMQFHVVTMVLLVVSLGVGLLGGTVGTISGAILYSDSHQQLCPAQ